nr:MAG TPA: hypothetical protein [Caudoviricetes sp.]
MNFWTSWTGFQTKNTGGLSGQCRNILLTATSRKYQALSAYSGSVAKIPLIVTRPATKAATPQTLKMAQRAADRESRRVFRKPKKTQKTRRVLGKPKKANPNPKPNPNPNPIVPPYPPRGRARPPSKPKILTGSLAG